MNTQRKLSEYVLGERRSNRPGAVGGSCGLAVSVPDEFGFLCLLFSQFDLCKSYS